MPEVADYSSSLAYSISMGKKGASVMSLTEDLSEYAKKVELDFIGFCSVESLNQAPEDRTGFYHEAGKRPKRLAGDLSHKHAAVACGLGSFGLNNLVISPGWGPRIRLATILTNAELKYDRILQENPCHDCVECVKICPVHALDGWKGKYDPRRGWVIEKKKCYDYIFTTLKGQRCGLCIKACPVGT